VAGLLAADHIFELDADVRGLAAELEGHPDNVAAAIEGGFVVCDGPRIHRLDPPMGLEAVLVIPREPVRTSEARAALPSEVPLADAAFNVAHASMLVLGLAQADWDLIAAGLADRLHQPYRARLYPRSADLAARAAALGALGATISGAGPAVLVWCHYEQTGSLVEVLGREAQGWAQVLRAPFETQGADVRSLG
jgi:homoserine kinase